MSVIFDRVQQAYHLLEPSSESEMQGILSAVLVWPQEMEETKEQKRNVETKKKDTSDSSSADDDYDRSEYNHLLIRHRMNCTRLLNEYYGPHHDFHRGLGLSWTVEDVCKQKQMENIHPKTLLRYITREGITVELPLHSNLE